MRSAQLFSCLAMAGYGSSGPAANEGRQDPSGATRTTRDGVYSEAQALRGQQGYRRACAHCHQADLRGDPESDAPAVSGASFLAQWADRTIADLFITISQTMPADKAGTLSAETYIDIVSFLLLANDIPVGDTELPPDIARLERIRIVRNLPPSQ